MSFFKSLKQLILKIEQKNIVMCSENVDEIISTNLDEFKTICDDLNIEYNQNDQNNFIDLTNFVCEVAKKMNYNSIKYFSPNKGIVDYLNQNDNQTIDEQKEDEFGLISQNHVGNLISFIDNINEEIKMIESSEMINRKLFIIKIGDVLLEKQANIETIKLATLINSFLEFFKQSASKFSKNKIKLLIIAKSSQGFNQLISTNNVEFTAVSISLPNKEERLSFYSKYKSRYVKLKASTKELNHPDFNEVITLSDGMSFREMFQLARIDPLILKDDLTFKELYSLIFFNKKDSEWEKIDFEKMKNIKSILSKRVKGQDYAIECATKSLIRSFTGMNGIAHSTSNNKKPKGILFFVGPTGVGKTELAKAISEFVFGEENRVIRFDMSEFNHEHSDQRLIGAPPGYVGYDSGGELTNAVKQKPFSILLFDEIEKAHGKILDKFLQILEDGRLKSAQGEIIDFSETFIIFTSNIGSSSFLGNVENDVEVRKHFIEAVSNHFNNELGRPEILNRINQKNIVPFNFVKDSSIVEQIITSKISKIKELLYKEKLINLEFKNNSIEKTVEKISKSFDKKMGGRGVITEIETHFIDPLSFFIFEKYSVIKNNQNQNQITLINVVFENNKINFEISLDME